MISDMQLFYMEGYSSSKQKRRWVSLPAQKGRLIHGRPKCSPILGTRLNLFQNYYIMAALFRSPPCPQSKRRAVEVALFRSPPLARGGCLPITTRPAAVPCV